MPRRRARLTTGLLAALAVAASLLSPGAAGAEEGEGLRGSADAPGQVVATGATAHARQVLAEAGRVLKGRPGREATLVLRDLAVARGDLSGSERSAAERILARPTDGASDPQQTGYQSGARPTKSCNATLCVHWATRTEDRPDLSDANGNRRPDYVDTVIATTTRIHRTYRRAGYKSPLPDGGRGGNGKPDIYLVDVGGQGLYGYCATDSYPSRGEPHHVPAYCVLDNDYSRVEFPQNSPEENLRVTAAHEYFHAVQFAYDVLEDGWFMEGTAAWVEDELFDDVDDNRQYLERSPMAQPSLPLDSSRGTRIYGSWIFFRYLSERAPASAGGLPTIVRDMWRQADSAPGAPDRYSAQAVRRVLAARGMPLPRTFAQFAGANRRPADTYEEGGAYPTAPPAQSATVGQAAYAGSARIDHLSSHTTRLRPAPTLLDGWRLRLRVDLADRVTAPGAVVTTFRLDGSATTRYVRLNRSGAGTTTVPFTSTDIRHVEVTLVNASTRFACGRGTQYSCRGQGRDDDSPATLRAGAYQP